VKWVETARHPSQIPSAIAAAWETALTPPSGPVWVEVPEDVLRAEVELPPITGLSVAPRTLAPRAELIAEAARLLERADRPVILAGGGVVRSGAERVLYELAEKLRAPVATTFGAKGAFPWQHPLSLQSWLEDWYTTEFLAQADALLVVGSGLGELSSNYFTLRPAGRVIQIEADPGKLEANHPALGIHADARLAVEALSSSVSAREPDGVAEKRVAELLARIGERLAGQDVELERAVLEAVRAAVPDDSPTYWDMTILGYWAWSAWDARVSGTMQSAQGAGGLGYGFPAALGAAVALNGSRPVLAVSGDGGAMYGIGELATARQLGLDVTWLIVDDGGYGILREYMTGSFGSAFGTELARPDFVALAEAFGVPARRATPESLHGDLVAALAEPGPSVVVLPTTLRMFAPTHVTS
jgi:acetolactate synthase I/II/III large subunit